MMQFTSKFGGKNEIKWTKPTHAIELKWTTNVLVDNQFGRNEVFFNRKNRLGCRKFVTRTAKKNPEKLGWPKWLFLLTHCQYKNNDMHKQIDLHVYNLRHLCFLVAAICLVVVCCSRLDSITNGYFWPNMSKLNSVWLAHQIQFHDEMPKFILQLAFW